MVAGLIGAAVCSYRSRAHLPFHRGDDRIRKPVVVPWIGLCPPIVRGIGAPARHAHPLVCLDPTQFGDFLLGNQEEMPPNGATIDGDSGDR